MIVLAQSMDDFFKLNLGDWASIIGVLVALIGFVITIVAAIQAKAAANTAKTEVQRLREVLLRTNTIADLRAAIVALEEIKRHQRQGTWQILPDRYSIVRGMLVAIRAANPRFTDEQKAVLVGVV